LSAQAPVAPGQCGLVQDEEVLDDTALAERYRRLG